MTRGARGAPRLVGVIMPVRNAAETLRVQLEALAAQTYPGEWEVVVVDHRSEDGTYAIARDFSDHHPRFRVVRAPPEADLGRVRQVGIDDTTADLLLFCDGDDEAEPGWIAAMADASRTADLLEGAIQDHRLNDQFFRDAHPAHAGSPRSEAAFDFLPFAIGANFGIWRDVLEDVGGWRLELPLRSGHDVVVCWKAQVAGYRMVKVPDAVMNYRFRSNLREGLRQMYVRGYDQPGFFKLFRAHGMPRSRFRFAAMTFAAVIYRIPSLLRGDPRGHRALLRAATGVGRIMGSIRWRTLYL